MERRDGENVRGRLGEGGGIERGPIAFLFIQMCFLIFKDASFKSLGGLKILRAAGGRGVGCIKKKIFYGSYLEFMWKCNLSNFETYLQKKRFIW